MPINIFYNVHDSFLPAFPKIFIFRQLIRFLEDPNYEEMIKAIREKDTEQAFHYAHTLKGCLLYTSQDHTGQRIP